MSCLIVRRSIAYQTVEVYRQTDRQANEEQPEKKSAVKGNTRVHV